MIADHNREALERVARFDARPAFALDRLTWTSDGRISYKLKGPWPGGRTHLVSEPVAFLQPRRSVGAEHWPTWREMPPKYRGEWVKQ